ncbi:hypothetical protein ACX93W_05240 [Paenibacillus sp. CAU 1782]
MTIVKVLVDAVGEYDAGDIVTDAPQGLIDIALKEVRNAATGQLLAEIVRQDELSPEPTERELELQMELQAALDRESELLEKLQALEPDSELKELKAAAKELKITGYTKMGVDELKQAIQAAGEGNAE